MGRVEAEPAFKSEARSMGSHVPHADRLSQPNACNTPINQRP